MNYSAIRTCDIADGPGVRVSLFVSGCTHCCKGCFNESTWDFAAGEPFAEETERCLMEASAPPRIPLFPFRFIADSPYAALA